MDLPPATTQTAREGIALCAGLRRHYVYSSTTDAEKPAVDKTLSQLGSLVESAKQACNVRDYVTLLIETAVLRLSMDLGPPTEELVEVARFVNPFLQPAGSGERGEVVAGSAAGLEPFRATDAALITDMEKDLLVLLYYCHVENIKGSPDEAIGHVGRMAKKYGDLSDLKTRKEPFLETEVRVVPAFSLRTYRASFSLLALGTSSLKTNRGTKHRSTSSGLSPS